MKRDTPSVLAVHLYDDFSGSANVCAQALSALREAGIDHEVWVGSHGPGGFIRRDHPARTFGYRLSDRRGSQLLNYAASQWRVFRVVMRRARDPAPLTIYVSTILPIGAVLAGVLRRRRVVVHAHEVGLGSRLLFTLLAHVGLRLADRVICVSQFVADHLPGPAQRMRVVYNTLSDEAWAQAGRLAQRAPSRVSADEFRIVMACSLRWYKGLSSLYELASICGRDMSADGRPVVVEWLVNADADELDAYLRENPPPARLHVVRRPASVFDHYGQADLVVNLSHREGWIETFGLTLLEAMACGIPVVAPQVGGCVELFDEGQGGWRIDSRDLGSLARLVERLRRDPEEWLRASRSARRQAERFSPAAFRRGLIENIT